MQYSFLLDAATAPAAQGQGGGLASFMPMILIFVIFYFLLIRPQQKKMKQHRAMVEAIKAGDEVVTSGGIYGVIKSVDNAMAVLTIADKVDIKISKSSIGGVVNAEAK